MLTKLTKLPLHKQLAGKSRWLAHITDQDSPAQKLPKQVVDDYDGANLKDKDKKDGSGPAVGLPDDPYSGSADTAATSTRDTSQSG